MTRAKLAEDIKKLLPDEKDKRIRQAIMKAYGGATTVAVGVRNTISQENRLQNGILVEGTVAITAPTSANLSGWAWVINFAIQEGADQTITITAPDATFPRIDYFHGDDAGLIQYAAGILDGTGNSLFPSIPEGNVILKKVLRNVDGSNDPIVIPPSGWAEAPINDQTYGRKNGTWKSLAIEDVLNLRQELDEILNELDLQVIITPNGLIQIGGYYFEINDLTVDTLWKWRFNDVIYQKSTETLINIPLTASAFTRIDIIAGNTSGNIVRIQGTPIGSPDVDNPNFPSPPAMPANHIGLFLVYVSASGISGTENFALASFVRYDTNEQSLSAVQRQNARANTQSVAKDVSDVITTPLWEFRDPINNQLKFRIRTGSQGGERLFLLDLFLDGGAQQMRYLAGTPQTGLGSYFPNFRWEAVGTSTRTLTTWVDGNKLPIFSMIANGQSRFYNSAPLIPRSSSFDRAVRRDELKLNRSQTIATTGTLHDLAITADTKLLILSGADDLTGVVGEEDQELIIYASGADRIIRHENAGSAAVNRFSIGADLTIVNGRFEKFIKILSRWRKKN